MPPKQQDALSSPPASKQLSTAQTRRNLQVPPSELTNAAVTNPLLDGIQIVPHAMPTRASLAKDKPSWPLTLSLEQNLLKVTIYHHEMQSMVSGSFWCWTYITSGLSFLGQKEMVFTLKRRATEREQDFHMDAVEWFSNIYRFAQSDMLVDQWDQSRFHREGFMDRDDIVLILYSPPLNIQGLPPGILPEERLHVIPATAPEADVVHHYGVMRFISQLGMSERWFPVLPWFDRDRSHCITTAKMTGTIRSMFPFISIKGVSAVKRGSDIVLHVPHKSAQDLKQALPVNDLSLVLGLDSYPHGGSDSGMTWTNQDTVPKAYGTGTTRVSLGFLVFCPDQDQDECMMREDGYVCRSTSNGRPCLQDAWLTACSAHYTTNMDGNHGIHVYDETNAIYRR